MGNLFPKFFIQYEGFNVIVAVIHSIIITTFCSNGYIVAIFFFFHTIDNIFFVKVIAEIGIYSFNGFSLEE